MVTDKILSKIQYLPYLVVSWFVNTNENTTNMKFVLQTFKKIYFLSFLFLFLAFSGFAQNQQSQSAFWNRVRFGGGIGLNFFNGGFNGSISPSAIYQFNDYVAAGLGANVNYNSFNDQRFLAYGPSAIVLANPIAQIQVSGEFEILRVNSSIQSPNGTFESDFWAPALFFGVGYRTQFATVGVRYNVLNNNDNNIYANAFVPFVRVYF